jgi:formylglycine-generating enzyme required for sulfatase activity
MSGNVWEVCSDYYKADYYSNSQTENPTGPESGDYDGFVVMRGGSTFDDNNDCKVINRGAVDPNKRIKNVGFRIVKEIN